MAKTHELGLSFHTVGTILVNFASIIARYMVKYLGKIARAGYFLKEKTFFESTVFWHTVKVSKGTPLRHRAYTGEIDGEFRQSNSHIFRITPRRALVVGSWQPKPDDADETDMLYRATNLDHERANEQSTEFDAAVVGLPADRATLPVAPAPGDEPGCGGSCGCK